MIVFLALETGTSEAAARAKFEQLTSADDGRAFERWLFSGAVSFPVAPLSVSLRQANQLERGRGSVRPGVEGRFSTETEVFLASGDASSQSADGGPALDFDLPALEYTLQFESEAYAPVTVKIDLRGKSSLQQLIILRPR